MRETIGVLNAPPPQRDDKIESLIIAMIVVLVIVSIIMFKIGHTMGKNQVRDEMNQDITALSSQMSREFIRAEQLKNQLDSLAFQCLNIQPRESENERD